MPSINSGGQILAIVIVLLFFVLFICSVIALSDWWFNHVRFPRWLKKHPELRNVRRKL